MISHKKAQLLLARLSFYISHLTFYVLQEYFCMLAAALSQIEVSLVRHSLFDLSNLKG